MTTPTTRNNGTIRKVTRAVLGVGRVYGRLAPDFKTHKAVRFSEPDRGVRNLTGHINGLPLSFFRCKRRHRDQRLPGPLVEPSSSMEPDVLEARIQAHIERIWSDPEWLAELAELEKFDAAAGGGKGAA